MSYVNLSSTRIGDNDLKELEDLDDVEVLDLSGTDVTDAGLSHLARLPRLQMLVLSGTHVTPAGIDTLRQSLPAVAILFSR
jgi:hypothetical protein